MSQKLYRNANVYLNQSFIRADILVENDTISSIFIDGANAPKQVATLDCTNCQIIPGIIDQHTHGGNNIDFNLTDAEGVKKVTEFFNHNGVTAYLAAILTDTEDTTIKQLTMLSQAAKKHKELIGVHLEGPFLSPDYKGAMPLHLLKLPDFALFSRYQKACDNLIKLVTVAPELPGCMEFIQQAVKSGVRVSIGHSGADYATAEKAIALGATACTHTCNAMRQFHHHDSGILGATLNSADLFNEIICDGFHLAPSTVRLISKIKPLSQLIIITDSIMAAGLPDGQYFLGVNKVTVKQGDARLTIGDARAGSTIKAIDGLNNFVRFTGIPLEQALPCATKNPAQLLGLQDQMGVIAPGKKANFVLLKQGAVIQTVVHGVEKL